MIEKVKKLKKEIGDKVEIRLNEFENNKDWFKELCFCILTANSKAETALKIEKEVDFLRMNEKELKHTIKKNKHRFHNNKAKFIDLNPDKFGRYRIIYRKKSKLEKCLCLFEENSEKHYRLKEHLYGLEGTTKDLKMAVKCFDMVYPRVRKNSITVSDIMNAFYETKQLNLKTVSKIIKRNKTVTYEYLNKLEKWKILNSERVGLEKYYRLNSILKIPRR